jgi:hypothetical protein
VSMVLASRRSLMPTPAAARVRCPRHRRGLMPAAARSAGDRLPRL